MPEMKIKPKFSLGQVVFLKTDPEQLERVVVGINVTANGLHYSIRHADFDSTEHSVMEIEETKGEIKKPE